MEQREFEQLVSNRRWKNRRRMAWLCLFAIFLVMAIAMFKLPSDRLEIMKDLIGWFFTVMAGIIGTYVGFSTLDDIKKPPAQLGTDIKEN